MLKDKEKVRTTHVEPYYRDEPLSELGFSFTEHVFGGMLRHMRDLRESRGGPGLPPFGWFTESFFIKWSDKYASNAGYRQPQIKVPKEGEPDPYMTYDLWPVPTQWYVNMMRKEFWELNVRSRGLQALQMGPLRYGIRYPCENTTDKHFIRRMDNGKVQKVKQLELTMQPHVAGGLADAAQEISIDGIKRLARAQQTHEAMAGLSLKQSEKGTGEGSSKSLATAKRDKGPASESDSDPEAREKRVSEYPPVYVDGSNFTQQCPRYGEIKQFLIMNRAEQKLALDTMGLLPQPTFYRYINDFNKNQNKFDLGVQEFKAFLSQCNRKKELFM